MDILIKAAQLILSLSILVVLHELGHFIPAKLFKTRVEKFYLFFNPWFSLFKVKKGETEYGVGWLPLGGYVKISGMVDESMDKEQMKQPPQPWEFRAKPAWQRLIIMVGGVVVNVLVGILLYIMIMFTWGESYLPTSNLKYGVAVDSTAQALGFRDGDKIVSIDGEAEERFAKIPGRILLDEVSRVEVDRGGQRVEVKLDEQARQEIIKNKSALFAEAHPFLIDSVVPGSPADSAGIESRSLITGLNGEEIVSFYQFARKMRNHRDTTVLISLITPSGKKDVTLKTTPQGTIGVNAFPPIFFLEYENIEYSFFESIPVGIRKGKETLVSYVQQFKLLFTAEGAKQIGGFGTFGSLFPASWNWQAFWQLTAFISMILAVMNILPIPALDGGHVMFLLYEIVTRRKPNEKVVETAQYAGMILLLLLVVFANLNDVRRLF